MVLSFHNPRRTEARNTCSAVSIYSMFVGSYEKGGEYVKVRDIIHTIKMTDEYFNMTKAQKRDFKEETVREFFKRNPVYRPCFQESSIVKTDTFAMSFGMAQKARRWCGLKKHAFLFVCLFV